MSLEKATFAAGCFGGVQQLFDDTKGVVSTTVGYTGGKTANPTYEDVCSGSTGHAEAVEVIFDSSQISYPELLEVFWSGHNPTTLNKQGPDIGTQYRSAIFYHTEKQKEEAEKSKKTLENSGKFQKPIVTEITAATPFYRAEEYHQKYFAKNGGASCHI